VKRVCRKKLRSRVVVEAQQTAKSFVALNITVRLVDVLTGINEPVV
jgi:hypothetical protein